VKIIINRVNSEICSSEDWWFRERKTTVTVNGGQIEHTNTISGKITAIVIDNTTYTYEPDFEKFYKNSFSSATYSLFNDMLLFPKLNEDKTATVFYLTNNYAQDSEGAEKKELELSGDLPLIPADFAEPVLVYGTCMRFKAMPDHPKFKHWNAEYIKALRNLHSQVIRSGGEEPRIVLKRQ